MSSASLYSMNLQTSLPTEYPLRDTRYYVQFAICTGY